MRCLGSTWGSMSGELEGRRQNDSCGSDGKVGVLCYFLHFHRHRRRHRRKWQTRERKGEWDQARARRLNYTYYFTVAPPVRPRGWGGHYRDGRRRHRFRFRFIPYRAWVSGWHSATRQHRYQKLPFIKCYPSHVKFPREWNESKVATRWIQYLLLLPPVSTCRKHSGVTMAEKTRYALLCSIPAPAASPEEEPAFRGRKTKSGAEIVPRRNTHTYPLSYRKTHSLKLDAQERRERLAKLGSFSQVKTFSPF